MTLFVACLPGLIAGDLAYSILSLFTPAEEYTKLRLGALVALCTTLFLFILHPQWFGTAVSILAAPFWTAADTILVTVWGDDARLTSGSSDTGD